MAADREYLLTQVSVEPAMTQELSHIGVDLDGITLPFVPRAVRVVALDLGGQSPGFDLGSVRARISHDAASKACCPNPVSGAGDSRARCSTELGPPESAAQPASWCTSATWRPRSGKGPPLRDIRRRPATRTRSIRRDFELGENVLLACG